MNSTSRPTTSCGRPPHPRDMPGGNAPEAAQSARRIARSGGPGTGWRVVRASLASRDPDGFVTTHSHQGGDEISIGNLVEIGINGAAIRSSARFPVTRPLNAQAATRVDTMVADSIRYRFGRPWLRQPAARGIRPNMRYDNNRQWHREPPRSRDGAQAAAGVCIGVACA